MAESNKGNNFSFSLKHKPNDMKRYTLLPACSFAIILLWSSCNNETAKTEKKEPKLKEETISYSVDSLSMKSYVVTGGAGFIGSALVRRAGESAKAVGEFVKELKG